MKTRFGKFTTQIFLGIITIIQMENRTMKNHIRIIHYVLAVVFIAVFSFAFSACTKEEENPEEPVDPSYTVGEVCSSRDGLYIYGKIYIPQSCEDKMPAVILSHSANLNAVSINLYAAGLWYFHGKDSKANRK